MISSIEFTTGKYGYVNAKVMKPVRHSVRDIGPRPFAFRRDPEERDRKLEEWNEKKRLLNEQYEKELAEYNKKKGEYENPYLAKCLINRKFRFSDNRVNVIVGPNGCGKSTIIRAIAAYAGCGIDGFPTLKEPSMLRYVITGASTEEDYDDQIEKTIVQEMKNPCRIDWDGTPVYFHNFSARLERAGSSFGSIQGGGGFITNCAEEAAWHISKGQMCGGERAVYMLRNLYETVNRTVCYDELFAYDSKRVNDVWMNTFEAQRRHYGKFRNFSVKKPCTLLLDELDQNFDIATNIQLYGEFLPTLIERTGIQIIAVSHSPIVLSDAVFNSERYNVISIDEEYTAQCRENLSNMFKTSEKSTGKKVKHIYAEEK